MEAQPTLDQLQVFLAVAETGSFSAAARRLNRAQSVPDAFRELAEKDLGGEQGFDSRRGQSGKAQGSSLDRER